MVSGCHAGEGGGPSVCVQSGVASGVRVEVSEAGMGVFDGEPVECEGVRVKHHRLVRKLPIRPL